MTTQLWAVAGVLVAAFFAALGSLFFKKGSEKLSLNLVDFVKNTALVVGFVFFGISTVVFVLSLRGGELSVLYPIAATSYIWVCLFSVKLLAEKMNKSKWVGIVLIIAGVGLIGFGST